MYGGEGKGLSIKKVVGDSERSHTEPNFYKIREEEVSAWESLLEVELYAEEGVFARSGIPFEEGDVDYREGYKETCGTIKNGTCIGEGSNALKVK